MSEEEFESNKRSIIGNLLERPKPMMTESDRLWDQIYSELYAFDTAPQDADHIKLLTKADMVNFFMDYIHPTSPSRAKLAVHLEASGVSTKDAKLPSANGTTPVFIEDVRSFKANLDAGAIPPRDLKEYEDWEGKR
ncbi:hypothetical protein CHGG_06876 [Chaetomium globosum CBS 148.51]|uniref:Uncharacterized protein n=1 Tax=Chaetomium globosum (strain ATCC 6205 / CBS 148.51 / DSM 1962 / NBRC 6347 / NRRL 1970) TaxID=306901 RepID=Q2GYS8_CHAGB|nr:uncharacterized protein CHGG_06876 [Chaetomium globosum CBS 148.51]EAQ85623.1 hypothetical protein CHGG_06876 [Chaetomium globosum CBS 148.51]